MLPIMQKLLNEIRIYKNNKIVQLYKVVVFKHLSFLSSLPHKGNIRGQSFITSSYIPETRSIKKSLHY